MTEQEQHLAFAEFCGHGLSEWFCNHCKLWIPAEHVTNDERCDGCGCEVESPDYLHDLNAMRDAMSKMSDTEWATFIDYLTEETGVLMRNNRLLPCDVRLLVSASCPQLAKCLLRTIGKWKD